MIKVRKYPHPQTTIQFKNRETETYLSKRKKQISSNHGDLSKDDILFFFIPHELEEREEVVDLLRSSYNLCVRQESYNGGWILVIIHPPGLRRNNAFFSIRAMGWTLS